MVQMNSLLREQLGQLGQINGALREDLCKLTSDWSKAVEEAGQRQSEWQKENEVVKKTNAGPAQNQFLLNPMILPAALTVAPILGVSLCSV